MFLNYSTNMIKFEIRKFCIANQNMSNKNKLFIINVSLIWVSKFETKKMAFLKILNQNANFF